VPSAKPAALGGWSGKTWSNKAGVGMAVPVIVAIGVVVGDETGVVVGRGVAVGEAVKVAGTLVGANVGEFG